MTNPQPFRKATYDQLALAYKIPRQKVEQIERKVLERILTEILSDPKIIDRYAGCLVDVASAINREMGLTMRQFVKYAPHHIIKRRWTL